MSVFCGKSRPAACYCVFEFVSFEVGFMLLPNEPCQYPYCDFCEKVINFLCRLGVGPDVFLPKHFIGMSTT